MFKAKINLALTLSLMFVGIASCASSFAASVDPTRPFGTSGSNGQSYSQEKSKYRLTSIIHGDGIHTAVIDGKIYKIFDYVGEYRITAINSHSVILRNKTERRKLHVFNSKGFKSNVVETAVAN